MFLQQNHPMSDIRHGMIRFQEQFCTVDRTILIIKSIIYKITIYFAAY
nr:MAG TPA: hypothetical protein [Caudoviricetes sp.]